MGDSGRNRFSTWVVASLLAALLVPALPVGAAEPAVVIRPVSEVQTVWTSEFGLEHPSGLAYDEARSQFLVAGDGNGTTQLLRLGADAEDGGIVSIPSLDEPSTLAFDAENDRLVAVGGTGQISLDGDSLAGAGAVGQRSTLPESVADAAVSSATFDPGDGSWLVLDDAAEVVIRVASDQSVTERSVADLGDPELVAANPEDGLLYALSPSERTVSGIDDTGAVRAAFTLGDVEVDDPVAMVFAPSTDTTDAADSHNLFIADSGGDVTDGGVTEVALRAGAPEAALAATTETAVHIRTTQTSQYNPGSPDPAGIAYIPGADRLVVVDSEVDETTGAGWNDVNMWVVRTNGTQTGTGTFWGNNAGLFQGSRGFSREPTGADFDATGNRLFVSDDTAESIFEVRPGPDGLFGNLDDVITEIDVAGLGVSDTEDPVYDPTSGDLFFLDGVGTEIYRIDPVDGVFGNGNDTTTHFDISGFGPVDFEGLTRDPIAGTLFVGARASDTIYEITDTGTLLRTILVDSVPGIQFVSGLQVAPSSADPARNNIYIVDRGVDNGADPNENDGKLYEIQVSSPPVGSPPMAVDDTTSTPQDIAVTVDVAGNDSDPDGDLDPSSAMAITAPGSGSTADNGDGTITYTPTPGTSGIDSFDYRICDLEATCATATVTVTVIDNPDPPLAVDDGASTPENTPVIIDVAGNDSDPEGNLDPTSASASSVPGSGSTADNADGTITYTPNPGFTGIDSFDYQICDTTALCDTATVTVAVGTAQLYYMSLTSSAVVPGIAGTVQDEDIISYDVVADAWEMYFDASDIGITGTDIDAVHVRPDGSVLMSVATASTITGLTGGPDGINVTGSDVLLFTPTTTGATTSGTISFFLDGSDIDLTTSGETINGLYEFTDGTLGITTKGTFTVGGLAVGGDEDIHLFDPTTTGANTTGTWTGLYFDGSDVGFATSPDDLDGISVEANGDLLYSTIGTNLVPGNDDEDINRFVGSFGPTTTGSATEELDMSTRGIDPINDVNALHVGSLPSTFPDDFADATSITGATGSTTASNVGATGQAGEPSSVCGAAVTPLSSIWFSWTAPVTAQVQVDTLGSDFDTYLHAYTGTDLGSLTEEACNDDVPLSGHSQAAVFFDATAGTTYHFQVDGAAAASGNVTLNWGPTPTLSPGAIGINPEGDEGSTFWDMPVTLSAPSTVPITLDWTTIDVPASPNVAHPGSDFVAASGSLTFLPGETTHNVTLEILGDLEDEPPLLWGEWGLVQYSNVSYTKPGGGLFGLGIFVIIDDDV